MLLILKRSSPTNNYIKSNAFKINSVVKHCSGDEDATFSIHDEIHIKDEYNTSSSEYVLSSESDSEDNTQRKYNIKKFPLEYSIGEYPCNVCGRILKSSNACNRHIESHMIYYYCEICDKGFKKMMDYITHQRSHSEKETFKCVVCDWETDNVSIMSQHVDNNHANGCPYKFNCKTCDKGFNVYSWYKEHNRNYHSNLKPFFCEKCETSFMYSRLLHVHNHLIHKSKSSSQTNGHECMYCKKVYKHIRSLNLHLSVHTGNLCICDICGKTLSNKERLKNHIRIHTGDKPYCCTYCGKCFTTKPILDVHIRIHTGEKPYKCEYCVKCFSQRTSLVIHTRGHTGEKPYVCNFCNKGFVSRATLNIHKKSCAGFAR